MSAHVGDETVVIEDAGDTDADERPQASLHSRIIAEIEAKILGGEWPPGHRIPYEHELTERYGCSRMTVSKALTELARAGLIERRRKAGSFVARPKSQSALLEIRDIAADVAALGLHYRFAVLTRQRRRRDPGGSRPHRRSAGRAPARARLPARRRSAAVLLGGSADQPRRRPEGLRGALPGPVAGRVALGAAALDGGRAPHPRGRRRSRDRRRPAPRRRRALPRRRAAHLAGGPAGHPRDARLPRRRARARRALHAVEELSALEVALPLHGPVIFAGSTSRSNSLSETCPSLRAASFSGKSLCAA